MPLLIDDLAAAVVTQLNTAVADGAFAPFTTATMNFEFNDTPLFDAPDLVTLRTTVMPFRFVPSPGKSLPGQRQPNQFRGLNEYQYVLSIGVQQLGPDGPPSSGVDPIRAFSANLRKLVQLVLRWLSQAENKRPIAAAPGQGVWLKTLEVPELYDMAMLRNHREFHSFFWLTYEEYVRE